MVSPVSALAYFEEAVIANGASLSGAVNLSGHILCGVYMPSAWTTAGLTFQASFDGTTFADVHFEDAEVTVTSAGASDYIGLQPQKFFGAKHLKVRSGTSSTAVAQGAERTLTLAIGRPNT